jgi:hypothetical protein
MESLMQALAIKILSRMEAVNDPVVVAKLSR